VSCFLAWILSLKVSEHHLSDPSPRDDLLPLQEPIGETLLELHVQVVYAVLGRLELEEEFEQPLSPLPLLCDSVKFTFLPKLEKQQPLPSHGKCPTSWS